MKLRNLSLALVLITVISGCSVRLVYPFLPWSLMDSVTDYVPINRAQKRVLKADIQEFYQWHRYQQLPLYATQLESITNHVQPPVTEQQVAVYTQTLLDYWRSGVGQLLPAGADLFSTLSDKQTVKLLANLDEDLADEREDVAKDNEAWRRKKLAKKMRKYTKRITGSVNHAQEQIITDWSLSVIDTTAQTLEQAERWHKQMSLALKERQNSANMLLVMQNHLLDDDQYWDDSYAKAMAHNQTLSNQLIADIINSLSEKQLQRSRRYLSGIAKDFRKLSNTQPDQIASTN